MPTGISNLNHNAPNFDIFRILGMNAINTPPPDRKSRVAFVIRKFSGLVATCITVCDYTLEDVLQDADQGMGGM